MKKFLYIISMAVVFAACAGEQLETDRVPGIRGEILGFEHDGKVTFGFNPVFSGMGADGATKAMVEGADIKNLYVAVFDGSGYKLSEYVKAEPVTTGSGLSNATSYQYTIELKVSEDKKRILHFIANAPEDLRFGSENEVIGELCTTLSGDDTQSGGFQNAYWQRIELPDGVWARPEEGADNYTRRLEKYNSVVSALNGVTLIRNYSKVTVDAAQNCYNFVLTGFWFVNYPDRGTIAPYNRNTKSFVTNYAQYPSVEALEGSPSTSFAYGPEDEYSIDGGNYQGFMLQATEFLTPSSFDDSNMHAVNASGVASGFVYEREKALISPMYIIVKGEYYKDATSESPKTGNPTTGYYKIAMQGDDGDFYAMLRNFNYLVRISSVSSAGKTSASDALLGTPTGDISVNVDYLDIPNISDGDARLTVNQTTIMIIGTNGQPANAEILYKYEPDIKLHPGEGLGNEWVPVEDPDHPITDKPYVTIVAGESGSTGNVVSSALISYTYKDNSDQEWKVVRDQDGNVISGPEIVSGGDGYGHISITTTEVGSLPKHQTFTITGKRYVAESGAFKTITRTVTLILRESLDMTLSVEPNTDTNESSTDYRNGFVEAGTGKDVILNIGIEENLPSSMFPMLFKIEPTNKTVTPDNAHSSDQDLPVRYGTDENGYPSYWFEKSITYSEYTSASVTDGMKTFPVWFKTILASSATDFKVSQEMFVSETKSLKNYTPAHFSTQLTGTHKAGVAETFSFSLDRDYSGDIFLTMRGFIPSSDESEVVYLNTDNEGNRIYKMSFSGYTSGTPISFDVIPYRSGVGFIELSAHLVEGNSVSVNITDGSVIGIDVSDIVSGDVKSNVIIQSYGSGSTYIRAQIVANWYDDEGNIVAPWDQAQGSFEGLAGSGWTQVDGIYYYGSPLSQGGSPNPLFTKFTRPSVAPVLGAHLEMTIMVQAIPYVNGRTCQQAFAE